MAKPIQSDNWGPLAMQKLAKMGQAKHNESISGEGVITKIKQPTPEQLTQTGKDLVEISSPQDILKWLNDPAGNNAPLI